MHACTSCRDIDTSYITTSTALLFMIMHETVRLFTCMYMHAADRRHPLRSLAEMMLAPEATRATVQDLRHHPALGTWCDIPDLFEYITDPSAPGIPSTEWLKGALATIQSHNYNVGSNSMATETIAFSETLNQDGAAFDASQKLYGGSTMGSCIEDALLPGVFSFCCHACICSGRTCIQRQTTAACMLRATMSHTAEHQTQFWLQWSEVSFYP